MVEGIGGRWQGAEGRLLAEEVFARLLAGKPVDDLALGTHDGRIDLRGLPAPVPARLKRYEFDNWFVEELGSLLVFREVTLAGIDFSGAYLDKLRFFHVRIDDCRFDGAMCRGWRTWALDVTDTEFSAADLSNSSLGPWYEGRGNVFRNVRFDRTNMKAIGADAATFIDCDFADAKLVDIEFGSSSFIRCRFTGLLKQVTFSDHGYETGKPDPNPMEDVDFSEARFRDVEFRGLNLDRVRLPTAEGHLVVQNYRCVLEHALKALASDPHPDAPVFTVDLEGRLRGVGPDQKVGVFAVGDYTDFDKEHLVALLKRCEQDCAQNDGLGSDPLAWGSWTPRRRAQPVTPGNDDPPAQRAQNNEYRAETSISQSVPDRHVCARFWLAFRQGLSQARTNPSDRSGLPDRLGAEYAISRAVVTDLCAFDLRLLRFMS